MSGDEAAREQPALEVLEHALGHSFRDRTLLETALTHSSYANENPEVENNERLEFLGDSVIGMVAADLLVRAHPSWREGDLTRALHQLVDRRGLSRLARELGLGAWLRLGRTEVRSEGHEKATILADAMEAVLGAMFLDGGVDPVRDFFRRVYAAALETDAPRVDLDPKTRFQEWVMEHFDVFPSYRDVCDSGVEGDEDRFTVEALIRGRAVAQGTARSKRIAERRAAAAAYAQRGAIADALRETAAEGGEDV